MKNADFTTEFGKEVFVLNFAYDDTSEAVPLIAECAEQVRKRPPGSVLTLTIVEKGKFNTELVELLKELTKGNAPYVRKAALVGIDGLYRVIVSAVSIFSKRDFKLFDTRNEAIKYLLQD